MSINSGHLGSLVFLKMFYYYYQSTYCH